MELLKVLLFALFSLLVSYAFPEPPENLNLDGSLEIEDNFDGKIINGNDAANGQFPFMVYLASNSIGGWICSSSILSKYYVITAAHCVFRNGLVANVSTFAGYAGNVDIRRKAYLKKIYFAHVAVHPFFQAPGPNDIALLRTSEAIYFDRFIQPIRMESWQSLFYTEFQVKLIGWGYTNCHIFGPGPQHPDVLQFSKSIPVYFDKDRSQNYLCHGIDVGGDCPGDSGGAMIVETPNGPALVGIISIMIPSSFKTSIGGCSVIVSDFWDFIQQAIRMSEKTVNQYEFGKP